MRIKKTPTGTTEFQFTHPGGVRLAYAFYLAMKGEAFQFTHPGGVRLWSKELTKQKRRVSIHAPGRGATSSSSTPCSTQVCFNSRTREGCDHRASRPQMHQGGFQFTHPGGVRHGRKLSISMQIKFQFTHPGGVRLLTLAVPTLSSRFQFTHPGGVRLAGSTSSHTQSWFQFTHPGGVRQYGAKLRIMGRINKRNLRLEVLL